VKNHYVGIFHACSLQIYAPPNYKRCLRFDDKYNEVISKIKILQIICQEEQSSKENIIQVEFDLTGYCDSCSVGGEVTCGGEMVGGEPSWL